MAKRRRPRPTSRRSRQARGPLRQFTESATAYATFDSLLQKEVASSEIVRVLSELSWQHCVQEFCSWSALIANCDHGALSPDLTAHYRRTVDALRCLPSPTAHSLADALGRELAKGRLVVAHERCVFFLLAASAHHCADDGRPPTILDVVCLMLLVNQHLNDDMHQRLGVSLLEGCLADLFRVSRFGMHQLGVNSAARTRRILAMRPEDDQRLGGDRWVEIQRRAFGGRTFVEFEDLILGPLLTISLTWGRQSGEPPVINEDTWSAKTTLTPAELKQHLARLAKTREELRAAVPLRSDGLPKHSMPLVTTPFIRDGARLWATSPRLVRDQRHGGMWNALRNATRDHLGTAKPWLSAFGEAFERYCVELVAESGAELLPTSNGGLELCDIALRERSNVALFECKARMIPMKVNHEAPTARELVDFIIDFYFAQPTPSFPRGGVLRQMNAQVTRVREGKYASYLSSGIRIYPCVVTYENFGETAVLYDWLEEQCKARQLLQQSNVAPVTIINVQNFEQLVATSRSKSIPICDLLREKNKAENRFRRLENFLCDKAPNVEDQTLPESLAIWEEHFEASKNLLFPGESGATSAPGEIRSFAGSEGDPVAKIKE